MCQSGAVLECVINISEGRNRDVLRELAAVCADELLDVHVDPGLAVRYAPATRHDTCNGQLTPAMQRRNLRRKLRRMRRIHQFRPSERL